MTDDRLMMAARAAGYSMVPPQDAADSEAAIAAADLPADLSAMISGYMAKVRSWLPAAPAASAPQTPAVRGAVANWLQSRAHA